MHADHREIALAFAKSIAAADTGFAAEQAIKGADALSETALHPILARGLTACGFGVHREVYYPVFAEPAQGAGDPARDRCDLVLTESPDAELLDPIHSGRRVRAAQGTLFAGAAQTMEANATADAVPPAQALWIEVKAVAQYAYRDGVPGPNGAYTSEIVNGPASDVCKLMGDGIIEQAAAVLVLFTESQEVAQHDIEQVAHRLLDMGLPIGLPETSCTQIEDRAGNTHATVAVFPIRGLGLALAEVDTENQES